MSPGWDNGSGPSAQVGHGSKNVSAKAGGNAGCGLSVQKVTLPSTPMLFNLALQTLPLLLPAALQLLQNFSRHAPPGQPSARKAASVPKWFPLPNAVSIIVDTVIWWLPKRLTLIHG